MKEAAKAIFKTALLCALALGLLLQPQRALAFRRLAEGERLADFTFYSPSGEAKKLSENLGPKATLILFWAAWSPRSLEALRDFQKLYEKHRGDGLNVVAVNVEHQREEEGDREAIATALKESGAAFPAFMDRGLEVYDLLGVNSTPSIIVADASMVAKVTLSGYPTIMRDEFTEKVESLLGVGGRAGADGGSAQAASGGKYIRYYQSALLFRKKGMHQKALESLKKALEMEPGHRDSLLLMAEIYEKEGNDKAAAEIREKLKP